MNVSNIATSLTKQDLQAIKEEYQKLHELKDITSLPDKLVKRVEYLQNIRDHLLDELCKAPSPRLLSVLEAIRYSIHIELALLNNFSLIPGDLNTKFSRVLSDFWVYDSALGKFINGRPKDIYTQCWAGDDFYEVEFNNETKQYQIKGSTSRFLLLSDEIEFLRCRKLVDFVVPHLEAILAYDYETINIALVDGFTRLW